MDSIKKCKRAVVPDSSRETSSSFSDGHGLVFGGGHLTVGGFKHTLLVACQRIADHLWRWSPEM